MANPLFNLLGNQIMGNAMPPILQQFLQFKQSFQGDPQQQVQQLLNSGRVSQQQYNNAVQMAQQLQKMLGNK